MSDWEAGVLFDCLEQSLHWEHLHDPHLTAHLNAEGVLRLAKLAGYSKQLAEKMASQHAWERMQNDLPM